MTDQLISNKKILIAGIIIIALLFYFQDSLPDEIAVQGIEVPQIELPQVEIPQVEIPETIEPEIIEEIIPDLIEVPPEEVMLEPSKVVNLNDFNQEFVTGLSPPQFTSFKQEVEWFALFEETRVTYPELKDVPLECDPLIRAYKAHTDLAIKSHLAKEILEVCDLG
jgi:hypothetical protein